MASKDDSNETDALKSQKRRDENRDPITGAPGSHPIGTGIGAAAGGAAGVAAGAAAGAAIGAASTGPAAPIGAAVGAVVGAVAGGLAGKGIAEKIDPTAEDAYWRENYRARPYVQSGSRYDDYQAAYQYGVEARSMHPGQRWEDIRDELRLGWNQRKGKSRLSWAEAENACFDAWTRCGSSPDTAGPQGQQPGAL